MRLGRRVNVNQDIDQLRGLPQDLGPNDIGSSLAWKRAGAALFQPGFMIDFVVLGGGSRDDAEMRRGYQRHIGPEAQFLALRMVVVTSILASPILDGPI
ncbi:hypothetical protein AS026_35440 [Rhizobium altiplani]|uniref:Uncharacterized protein n=1 Tax=Rhizobium altiplani TaxID=1864509 RepID=A0A109JW61_9HYPH|nr:hypothetical protein AS026_35440 [Rhizobium altiplani]